MFGLVFLAAAAVVSYYVYTSVLQDNIKAEETEIEFFIPENADFDAVVDSLNAKNILKNEASFRQVAKLKKYPDLVKPGRYLLTNTWNNNELVNHLRSGKRAPIKFVVHNARTKADLAGVVSRQLPLDSVAVLNALNDSAYYEEYGFTNESFPAMFLANTYEMYWNTDLDAFMERMNTEFNRYWNDERKQKAAQLGLSQAQVITLASIVEEETKVNEELPIVAGLYLNRLQQGIPLQADPTVKFAVGDFTLRRILNRHLEINSPYNTYQNTGLPPGPIRIPELNAVSATLSPQNHDYLYMCAKPDFSGKHAFAKTLAEHNRNAAEYHRALNNEGIQ